MLIEKVLRWLDRAFATLAAMCRASLGQALS
jgi:hypothetical protein